MRTPGPFVDLVSTDVYTSRMSSSRAKIFQNGGSQAIRLPKDFRFPEGQDEVVVRRDGLRVILEPVDAWPQAFMDCLGKWSEEIDRPKQSRLGALKDPFK